LTRATDFNLNAGLVLSIPMFEGTGTVSVKDVAKPHHPVLFSGAPTWATTSSGLSYLSFAAATPDYLSIAAASCIDLDFTSGMFSVAMWAYVISWSQNNATILCHGNSVTNTGWRFTVGNDKNLDMGFITAGGRKDIWSPGNVNAGAWYLCGFSRESTTKCSLYLNGYYSVSGSDTFANPLSAAAANLYVATLTTAATFSLNGYVALPRIWSRTLTSVEHMQIFNAEREFFGV